MANMVITQEDLPKLKLTRDRYGNLVGQELPVPWQGGAPAQAKNVSHAFCPECNACLDGTWEGARVRCKCGYCGYYPKLRFEKVYK